MNEYQKAHIAQTIQTMREGCDEAERRLADGNDTPLAVARVLHALSWAYANVTTGLETALRAYQREQDKQS